MVLPFMDRFPDGTPTYFEEKLNATSSLENFYGKPIEELKGICEHIVVDAVHMDVLPKLTTIREDANNRWKPGMHVHGYYHNRTKHMRKIFDGTCVSIQRISITCVWNEIGQQENWEIKVNGRKLCYYESVELIHNDGLTLDQFKDFFRKKTPINNWKIIHFTNLKY